MGPLFYCDDVIGVVVSGFNRGSTLEYPAPYIDRWKSARDYDKLAEAYVNDESEPDDKRFRGSAGTAVLLRPQMMERKERI